MKKLTDKQARATADRIRFVQLALQTLLQDKLGDQFDSVTVIANLKPGARSKKHPCVAVVMGTLKFDNALFALKSCIEHMKKEIK
jgi:hypothetical protein